MPVLRNPRRRQDRLVLSIRASAGVRELVERLRAEWEADHELRSIAPRLTLTLSRLRGDLSANDWSLVAREILRAAPKTTHPHIASAADRTVRELRHRRDQELEWRAFGRPRGILFLVDLKARCDEARVSKYVDSPCWVFKRKWKRRRGGYGIVTFEGARHLAHRVAYLLANELDELPNAIQVLHQCHNPGCCNPAHLELGGYEENAKQRVEAGRQGNAAAEIAGCTVETLADLRERCDRRAVSGAVDDECWLYLGRGEDSGHQVFVSRGRTWLVHRWAFMRHADLDAVEMDRRVLAGRMVLHHCDVASCCNPAHLYEGDARENARDAVERGRQPRGEDLSDLTKEEILDIRYRAADGEPLDALAAEYLLGYSGIHAITTHRTWTHVGGPVTRRVADRGAIGGTPLLDASKVREIARRHAKGASAQKLAKAFEVSPDTVRRVLWGETWGHVDRKIFPPRRRLASKTVRAIRTAHAGGLSTGAIAEEYGLTPAAIRNILCGKVHRGAGGPIVPFIQRKLSSREALEMRARHARGATPLRLAGRFRVSVETVRNVLRGVTHRDAGGPIVRYLQIVWSDAVIRELRQRYAAGELDFDAAMVEYGFEGEGRRQYLRDILTLRQRKGAGGPRCQPPRHSGYVMTPAVKADIIDRLRAGETGKSIASRLGISNTTVSEIKRTAGVVSPRELNAKVRDDKIRRLLRLGRTGREIARQVGCSEQLVSRTRHQLVD